MAAREQCSAELAGQDPRRPRVALHDRLLEPGRLARNAPTGTSVQAIQIYKQGGTIFHASAVQREVVRNFVVSADFVYRHFVH